MAEKAGYHYCRRYQGTIGIILSIRLASHKPQEINVNVWMLVIAAVLLVTSGCATGPRKVAPDYVSPLEYQTYSCEQLGAELSKIVRWAHDKDEKTLRLLSNEVGLIGQFAKEHNCQDLIQLFDRAEDDARNDPEWGNKALSMLGCLGTSKSYRQPQWFVMTFLACAILVEISD